MKTTNQDTNTNLVWDFLDNLINVHQRKEFYKIPDFELEEFAGLLIKENKKNPIDRGDAISFISESDDADETALSLANYLISGSTEECENFIDTIKKNTVRYFEREMEKLFEERVIHWENTKMDDAGFIQKSYEDNGEHYWARY